VFLVGALLTQGSLDAMLIEVTGTEEQCRRFQKAMGVVRTGFPSEPPAMRTLFSKSGILFRQTLAALVDDTKTWAHERGVYDEG